MGVVVGDYIHLSYKNYLKYGINFNTESIMKPEQVLSNIKKSILQQYKNTITKNDIQLIRNYYNFLFDPSIAKNSFGLGEKELAQFQQAVLDELYKVINKNKFGINLKQGSVYLLEKIANQSKNKYLLGEEWTSTDKIRQAYYNIINIAQSLADNDDPKTKIIKSQIEKIHQEIMSITSQVSKFGSEQEQNAFESFLQKKEEGIKNQSKYVRINASEITSGTNNLFTLMNQVNQYFIGKQLAGVMGQLGENLLPAIQNVIKSKTAKVVSGALQDLKVEARGGQSVRVTHVTPSASIIGGQKYQPFSYVTRLGEVKVNTTSKVEEKVDIIINIGDNAIGASIKNYSPKTVESKGVGLLSGSNLLNYIHNDANFANHYFNITAEHSDQKTNSKLLKQAHNMLRLKMAAMALAGGLNIKNNEGGFSKEAEAQLFIINRRKGGRANFEIYTIEELLRTVTKNYNLVDMDNYDITWKNAKMGDINNYRTAYARCLNILQQARAFQIRVSLKAGALK